MKISQLLTGTALTVIASGAAMAADLPGRAAAPSPAPVFVAANWSGAYVGVNVGMVATRTPGTVFDLYSDGTTGYEAQPAAKGDSGHGALAGLTAGYNFQSGNLVYGVEADVGGIFGDKVVGTQGDEGFAKAQTKALATLRARVGLSTGATLYYLTAGVAGVQQKLSVGSNNDSAKAGSSSKWKIAPVAGAGVEQQLGGGWSAKVEGLYIFQTKNNLNGPMSGGSSKAFSTKSSHVVVRVGVNYSFGAQSNGPILARY